MAEQKMVKLRARLPVDRLKVDENGEPIFPAVGVLDFTEHQASCTDRTCEGC